MFLAPILTLCLQLGAAPNAFQQAVVVSPFQAHETHKFESAALTTLSQNASPTLEQNAGPSSTSSPVASPASPSTQTGSQPSQTEKTATPSSAHKKKKRRKPTSNPGKVVVRNGSTPEPSVQFSTTATPEQETHERQSTAGLLATTQANLQKLSGRQLSSSQQDTLTEIRGYMKQAKAAEDAGDLQSAQNLALKAQLLSSELVRK